MRKHPSNTPALAPLPAPPFPASRPPRIAIYSRVSSLDQTPEQQGHELREWANRLGGTIALDVSETGSGASNGRPGLQKLMAMAQRGQLTHVAVWKLDRFGRSALDVLTNIRRLTDAGVSFFCITQGITLRGDGDAMSNLQIQILTAVSEFERTLIQERTRSGLARARARGKKLGRPRHDNVTIEAVVALRQDGRSWKSCAATLGASVSLCRLRYREGTTTKVAGR